MVTQPDELIAVRTLFKLARQELKRENIDLPEKLALGAMVEVPAAAINVRALLEHADFLAIGTNDLAQYVLAADRGNDALDNIYNPLQPALLRLLSYVIAEGRRAKKPVSLCGEIGGDTSFTPCCWRWACVNSACIPASFCTCAIASTRSITAHCAHRHRASCVRARMRKPRRCWPPLLAERPSHLL